MCNSLKKSTRYINQYRKNFETHRLILIFVTVNHINSFMWSNNMLQERAIRSSSLSSTDSFLSIEFDHDRDQPPFFLQLNCSIRSKSTNFSSNPVKLLPTCFTEIAQDIEDYNLKDTTGLKVTLDIICLSLSKEVLQVSFIKKIILNFLKLNT